MDHLLPKRTERMKKTKQTFIFKNRVGTEPVFPSNVYHGERLSKIAQYLILKSRSMSLTRVKDRPVKITMNIDIFEVSKTKQSKKNKSEFLLKALNIGYNSKFAFFFFFFT